MNQPIAFADTLRRPLPEALASALRARFDGRFSTAQAVRDHHGRDESPFPATPPEAVVFAQSTDDVVDLVNLCREHKYPVIPYGAGSSLEGHVLAVHGGVSLDLSQMNRVARNRRRGSHRDGPGRRAAQAAQRGAEVHRSVLPD